MVCRRHEQTAGALTYLGYHLGGHRQESPRAVPLQCHPSHPHFYDGRASKLETANRSSQSISRGERPEVLPLSFSRRRKTFGPECIHPEYAGGADVSSSDRAVHRRAGQCSTGGTCQDCPAVRTQGRAQGAAFPDC